MQTNIVLIRKDEFHLKLAAYIKSVLPDVVITAETQLLSDHHFLSSIADKSLLIEVGPIAQGSLDYSVFANTEKALRAALKFVQLYNNGQLPQLDDQLPIMSYFGKIYFPTDEAGNISASIHPDLIGKDYSSISAGTPLFKDFSGKDIEYQGEPAHIAFVNEAAYYDQKIAMCLCRPNIYSLSSLSPLEAVS